MAITPRLLEDSVTFKEAIDKLEDNSFTHIGSGAVPRPLDDRLNETWSVLDFGAVGDGVADDTAAVQAAYNALVAEGGGTLIIPTGTYRCNLLANSRLVNIAGHNAQASILTPADPTKPTITLNTPDGSTRYPNFYDFGLISNTQSLNDYTTIRGIGIQFGTDTLTRYTEYTGRMNFDRLSIQGFNKAVYRPYGNILVKFDDCELRNNNYHFFSVGQNTQTSDNDVMHPGCITVRGGVWTGGRLAAFYLKGPTVGTGQVTIENVVIDTNAGYIFYIDSFHSVDGQPGMIIRNCWNEQNADGNDASTSASYLTTVEGDGPLAPVWGVFKNAQGIRIENTPVGSLHLTNTVVITKSCSVDRMLSYTFDTGSALYHDDASAFTNKTTFGMFRSLAEPNGAGDPGFSDWFRQPLPYVTSRAYKAYLLSASDANTNINFTGNNNFSTTDIVAGGVLTNVSKTQRLNMTATCLLLPVYAVANMYVVCTYIYRRLSGPAPSIQMTGNTGISVPCALSATDWECLTTVSFIASDISNLSLYHNFNTGNASIEIGGYSILQFPSKHLALDYINSKSLAIA